MQDYQQEFLDFVVEHQILKFGQFTLRSGRVSPYFFNTGLFNTGNKLRFLCRCYAAAIAASGLPFDLLFGPAYKGVPLAAGTAMALAEQHGMDVPYCFNRKEAKNHGEGGTLIGARLTGKVLVIDDVIATGTAASEAADLIHSQGAELATIAVAVDRQERDTAGSSAKQQLEQRFGIKVISIIRLQHIMDYLQQSGDAALQSSLAAVEQYQQTYGTG